MQKGLQALNLAVIHTRGREGIKAPEVTVEVHISNGLPAFSIVGLPETAVKESKDRVRGALLNCNFEFPMQRITVNMAPADIPKEGGRFDLAIALGILVATGQLPKESLKGVECIGELSLGGELRSVSGVLPIAMEAKKAGRALILPTPNGPEAALVNDARILPASHLLEVSGHLKGHTEIKPLSGTFTESPAFQIPDFSDVHGHYQAKRALEIAAAGRHNLLMLGSPGTGKSMLASRLPGILPFLTEQEALESAAVHSISGIPFDPGNWRYPPFRSPHHTASGPALVGGGGNPKPGEVSLATNGVLFMDELPEYDRKVLEVLREPLETGHITISRALRQVDFPARFQLIAAMNPCPCGYLGDVSGRCRCTVEQVGKYRARISGPLMDRIDMHIEVPRVSTEMLRNGSPGGEESSETIRKRVTSARNLALERTGCPNAWLTPKMVKQSCNLTDDGHQLLEKAIDKLGLSHRAYNRILKLSRTIADLAGENSIAIPHLSEAIGYRKLDRNLQ